MAILDHASAAHWLGNLLLIAVFAPAVVRALPIWQVAGLLIAAQVAGQVCQSVSDWLVSDPRPMIGLSVVGYGLIAAYGLLYPASRPCGLPLTGRQIVLLTLIITLLLAGAAPHSAIAHAGHWGGMIGGLIFMQLREVTRKNT